MNENIPSLMKYRSLQIQEAEQNPNSRNSKISIPRHIIIYLLKTKDKQKNLKSGQRKTTYYYYLQGNTDVSDCGFSSEITEPRRKWYNIFTVLKENCQPRIWYPVTVSFCEEGETDILRWRKTKGVCSLLPCSERAAKRSILDRSETVPEGNPENWKWGKSNRNSKYLGKCGRESSFPPQFFKVCLVIESKSV